MFWPARDDPSILTVHAVAAQDGDPDALDLRKISVEAVIAREPDGLEHVVIADGPRRLRLEVRGESLTSGPVALRYELSGFAGLRQRLLSLSRLEALKRLGRLPRNLYASDPVSVRWSLALAAWDLRHAGASQIDIAVTLFGDAQVDADSVERMRKRVARLLLLADRRVIAGYRRFLSHGRDGADSLP